MEEWKISRRFCKFLVYNLVHSHLTYLGLVRSVLKDWRVVVDILNCDKHCRRYLKKKSNVSTVIWERYGQIIQFLFS